MIQDIENKNNGERGNKYMIKVDKRSKDSVYITIKSSYLPGIPKWVIYIDNSTGEHIIESWCEE